MHSVCFEDLYRDHYGYVSRSLVRLGVDFGAVEDLAQDVFVVVHRRLCTYDPARPFEPWLFGIVFNVVRERRRLARRRPQPRTLDRDVAEDDHGFAEVEAARTLDGMLARLSPEKRAVILLCEIDGATPADAARALGISVEAVYSRLRRGRAELARMAEDPRARTLVPPPLPAERGQTAIAAKLGAASGALATVAAGALVAIAVAVGLGAFARGASNGPSEGEVPAAVAVSPSVAVPPSAAPSPGAAAQASAPVPPSVAASPSTAARTSARPSIGRLAARHEPATSAPAAEEWMLIQEASLAIRADDSPAALDALARHAARHPRGAMSEERERLAIEALVHDGRTDDAARRAAAFRRAYPASIYAADVDRLVSR